MYRYNRLCVLCDFRFKSLGVKGKRIVNIADEAGVPIFRDDSVAALLVMLNAGETIPKELYQIVASIYAEVVYTANDMRKK